MSLYSGLPTSLECKLTVSLLVHALSSELHTSAQEIAAKWMKGLEGRTFQNPLNKKLTYDPAIPLLGIYLEKTLIQKDACTSVFITALFTIANTYSVQLLICVRLFVTPWTAAHQASLSITNPWSLLKLMSIESVMPSNYLILHPPLLLLPSIIPSIKVFSNESIFHIRWPKYWSFSFSISPSNEYSGLISFRIDWLDPLAVQGTLKSLFQHHSSKANTWKQPKYPLTDEWLKKMWYVHTIG